MDIHLLDRIYKIIVEWCPTMSNNMINDLNHALVNKYLLGDLIDIYLNQLGPHIHNIYITYYKLHPL